jgi:hypothetical protein
MSIHWGGRGAGHISRWSASTTGVPALVLDFLTTTSLDSRITFTRASTATFVGSNGLIQSAAINAPRFDYDPVTLAAKGLLIEEQRTNLVTYSEQFNDASWTKTNATITANATTSPDGTTNADTLVENTALGTHDFRRNISASASTAYTQSIFLKAAGRTRGQMQMFGNGGGTTVTFNLTTVTATAAGSYGGWTGASATITNYGNGWYRITSTATTNVGLTVLTYATFLENAAGSASYTGDGVSGMHLYGAQFEAGAFATSYIPTVAATVIRSADVAAMTGTNFSDWYNQNAGTFVASFQNVVDTVGGGKSVFSVNDGTNNNRIAMITTSALVEGRIVVGGVATNPAQRAITANAVAKSAIGAEAGSAAQFTNGVLNSVVAPSTLPTVNRLEIGANLTSTFLNGHIRAISYYNTRLLNSQLQTLAT